MTGWRGLAVAGLAVLPTAATAGPITWSYQVLDLGVPNRVVAEARGLPAGGAAVLPGQLPRPTAEPRLLWGLPAPVRDVYPNDTFTVDYIGAAASVRFTDDATGDVTYDAVSWRMTGTWKVNGYGDRWVFLGPDGGSIVTNYGDNYAGGHRFDVAADPDGTIRLSMTPDVPNPRDVPEPATVVLAGFGLVGVGLRRLRRPSEV